MKDIREEIRTESSLFVCIYICTSRVTLIIAASVLGLLSCCLLISFIQPWWCRQILNRFSVYHKLYNYVHLFYINNEFSNFMKKDYTLRCLVDVLTYSA